MAAAVFVDAFFPSRLTLAHKSGEKAAARVLRKDTHLQEMCRSTQTSPWELSQRDRTAQARQAQ